MYLRRPVSIVAPLVIVAYVSAAVAGELRVDAQFPGGNIVVDKIDGDVVSLRQDLRDTRPFWFYWRFRVAGAGERTIRFRFTDGAVFGPRGPALSVDGGHTWRWLGADQVVDNSFVYNFSADRTETQFAFAIPYLERNLRQFLESCARQTNTELAPKKSPRPAIFDSTELGEDRRAQELPDRGLMVETLAETAKGRKIELVRAGRLDGKARWNVLLTACHHSCEMLADYVLEGLLSAVLAADDDGQWFRENVQFTAIPFMDKDGVEDGDQGKQRQPYDHWLDYLAESRYASTEALRRRYESEPHPPVDVALDLHCPSLRDQRIYFAFGRNADVARQGKRLSELLAECRRGPLRHAPVDNIPYGQGWNVAKSYEGRKSFHLWAEELPGIRVAATLEIPYATVLGAEVTADNGRLLGRDLARALRRYFEAIAPN